MLLLGGIGYTYISYCGRFGFVRNQTTNNYHINPDSLPINSGDSSRQCSRPGTPRYENIKNLHEHKFCESPFTFPKPKQDTRKGAMAKLRINFPSATSNENYEEMKPVLTDDLTYMSYQEISKAPELPPDQCNLRNYLEGLKIKGTI